MKDQKFHKTSDVKGPVHWWSCPTSSPILPQTVAEQNRGDALATTVGKQSLRSWWFRLFSPKLWSNALMVSRRNLLRSKKQSSLKLITPAALAIPPSGAACWPEELPLTWWSNKASWEALMFGRSESKRDPPLSWPNDVRIKGVLNGFWSSTSVNA